MEDTELFAWMTLNRVCPGGTRQVRELLQEGFPAVEVLERFRLSRLAAGSDLSEALQGFSPAAERDACARRGIQILTRRDGAYPEALQDISDPPLVLYVAGDLEPGDRASVAIVGSRNASPYGLAHARQFAVQLAERGVTIISGLAQGIDQAAHAGALEVSYGRTIGVLGCGLDVIYPRSALDFYARLPERGALISEYSLGTKPLARHFPCRNRIISGLALGVLVMEAHDRSGSLITAREALDQGRDVFALPGQVGQLGTGGTNRLIKEGAYLLDCVEDVLEILAPELGRRHPVVSPRTPPPAVLGDSCCGETNRILEVLRRGDCGSEELAARSGLPGDRLAGKLTELELEGLICREKTGLFKAAGRL